MAKLARAAGNHPTKGHPRVGGDQPMAKLARAAGDWHPRVGGDQPTARLRLYECGTVEARLDSASSISCGKGGQYLSFILVLPEKLANILPEPEEPSLASALPHS